MKRISSVIFCAVALLAVASAPAGAASVANGNFSDGLAGWNVWNDESEPSVTGAEVPAGIWTIFDGPELPRSGHIHTPSNGGPSAVADSTNPSSSVLWQDVNLEAGSKHTLTFKYWYANDNGSEGGPEGPGDEAVSEEPFSPWVIPDPLTFVASGGGVQLVRVDVVKASADPASTDPADILKTVLMPSGTDPANLDWTDASVDLSEFAGQAVKLRFANTGNQFYLHLGIDDVAISSKQIAAPDPGRPTLDILSVSPTSYSSKGKPGVNVAYKLNRGATITVRALQARSGRMDGDDCVRATRQNKRAKKCTRWIKLSGLHTFDAPGGINSYAFTGTLDGKKLGKGRYQLLFSAYVMGYGQDPTKATASFSVR